MQSHTLDNSNSKGGEIAEVVVSVNTTFSVPIQLDESCFTESGELKEAAIEAKILQLASRYVKESILLMDAGQIGLHVEAIQTGVLDAQALKPDLKQAAAVAIGCSDLLARPIVDLYDGLIQRAIAEYRRLGSSAEVLERDLDLPRTLLSSFIGIERTLRQLGAFELAEAGAEATVEPPSVVSVRRCGQSQEISISPELAEQVAAVAQHALLDVQKLLELGFDTNIREKSIVNGVEGTVAELAELVAQMRGTTTEAVLEDVYSLGGGDDNGDC